MNPISSSKLRRAERYRKKLSNKLTKYYNKLYDSGVLAGGSVGSVHSNLTKEEGPAVLFANQKRNYDILADAFSTQE